MATDTWEDDLATSTRQFKEIVWPEIRGWFGEDPMLHAAEGRDDALYEAFDQISGVDFWLVDCKAGMASIASRVQKCDETTFTIRHSRSSGVDTEHQKRMRQLHSDYELPTWTVQAYVDPVLEMLRNAAACRTDDLFQYIGAAGRPGDEWPLIQSDEDEFFYPVEWGELDSEINIRVHNRQRAGLVERPDDPSDITAWGNSDD